MKCRVCGKFMEYENTYDFTDYYRCKDDCERGAIPNPDSEEKNMDYADKINNLRREQKSPDTPTTSTT